MGDGVSHRDKPEKDRVYYQWFELDDTTPFPDKFKSLGDAINWGFRYASSGCLAPEILKSKLWKRAPETFAGWVNMELTLEMLDNARKTLLDEEEEDCEEEDVETTELDIRVEATFSASANCIVKSCGGWAYDKGATEKEARDNILVQLKSAGWKIKRGFLFCKEHG